MQKRNSLMVLGLVFVSVSIHGFTSAASCTTTLSSSELLQVKVATKNLRKIAFSDATLKNQQTDLLKKLQLQSCGNGVQGFVDNSVSSYTSLKSDVIKLFVRAINSQNNQSELSDTTQPMKTLSQHVQKYFGILSPDATYIMQTNQGNMQFSVKNNEVGTIQGSLQGKGEGKFDIAKGFFDMTMDGTISLSVKNPLITEPAIVSAKGNISLLHNGSTYLKFNTLSLDMSLPAVIESEILGSGSPLADIKDKIAQIPTRTKDTYIDLGNTTSSNDQSMGMSAVGVLPKSWGKFVYKDGDTYYGMPSADWCPIMGNATFTITKCQKAMQNIGLWTQGKGIMYLKKSNGTYVLGFTKKFLGKNIVNHIPSYRYEKDLISRNDTKILSITLPLDKTSKNMLIYKNDMLQIQYSDLTSTVSVSGPLTSEGANLTLSFSDSKSKIDGTGILHMKRTKTDNGSFVRNGDGSIIMNKSSKKIMDMSFTASVSQQSIAPFTVAKPQKVITADEFTTMFDLESFTK